METTGGRKVHCVRQREGGVLTTKLLFFAKTPWSWGRVDDFCSFFRMGRGIESQSFSLLIASFSFIRLFDIIRPINTFHGPTTYNSMRWKRRRHARRDEEERPAGVSGMVTRKDELVRFEDD